MDIISRAAAGLPPRPSGLTRHTGDWPGITWHHTGGSPTTWRGIYDWQVINRPKAERLVDIGYSYGIRAGRVTELRGWDYRPAGDHQNSRLQVVFMGTFDNALPPAADLAAALEFARYAEQRAGRPLPGTPHRDIWPAGHEHDTDCPGNTLTSWVRANLTTIGDTMPDYSPYTKPDAAGERPTILFAAETWRLLRDGAQGVYDKTLPARGGLLKRLDRIEDALDALKATPPGEPGPAPIVTDEQLERALDKVARRLLGIPPA